MRLRCGRTPRGCGPQSGGDAATEVADGGVSAATDAGGDRVDAGGESTQTEPGT